jgi:hypothetical protein
MLVWGGETNHAIFFLRFFCIIPPPCMLFVYPWFLLELFGWKLTLSEPISIKVSRHFYNIWTQSACTVAFEANHLPAVFTQGPPRAPAKFAHPRQHPERGGPDFWRSVGPLLQCLIWCIVMWSDASSGTQISIYSAVRGERGRNFCLGLFRFCSFLFESVKYFCRFRQSSSISSGFLLGRGFSSFPVSQLVSSLVTHLKTSKIYREFSPVPLGGVVCFWSWYEPTKVQ